MVRSDDVRQIPAVGHQLPDQVRALHLRNFTQHALSRPAGVAGDGEKKPAPKGAGFAYLANRANRRDPTQSSSFGSEALTCVDSRPVLAYVCSFSRVSTISSVRMVSWPIRSSGVNIDSPFSIVSRSGL